MDWDWFWEWTGDDVVWAWFRTAAAALFGALAGGLFTLLGQARQAKAQRDLQTLQFDAEVKAAESRWERERLAAAHHDSLEAARELFEGFTALLRAIQAAKPTISDIVSGESWQPHWKEIWTDDVSLDLDVRSRLIADDHAQSAVRRIVTLLDQIADVTADSSYPTAIKMRLRDGASNLTAEAIEVMGAYIRRVKHESKRGELLDGLEAARKRYSDWEDYEVARSIAAAEAIDDDESE